MKPHHDFTAERALARHAGLVAQREAQNVDPASGLTRLTERLAADLPELLGALGGETMPEVKALWDKLLPGVKRNMCYWVRTGKTAPTRAKRIAELIRRIENREFERGRKQSR